MARRILVVGAGKSTSYLLDYFLEHSEEEDLLITVADKTPQAIPREIQDHSRSEVVSLDISDEENRKSCVRQADIVVSMLPAALHLKVAQDCLEFGKNLVTASYSSQGMRQMDPEVRKRTCFYERNRP